MQILVIDDHPLFLEAVCRQISTAIPQAAVEAVGSLSAAVSILTGATFDLVLLDWSLPDISGLAALDRLRATTECPIAVMSGIARAEDVRACINHGARGFLPKTLDSRLFVTAVSMIAAGGTYVPAEFVGGIGSDHAATGDDVEITETQIASCVGGTLGPLSDRDKVILRMIAAGASNKEIATGLEVQEATVKFHLVRLFRRLNVKNRSQAAAIAVKIGF